MALFSGLSMIINAGNYSVFSLNHEWKSSFLMAHVMRSCRY